ncbi:MAG: hemerythrin domain-containing protein [Betaproteobacteria bacterium]
MPLTATLQQAAQELQEDHRRLHERIDRLALAGDLAQMSAGLAALHERLAAHFDAEEKPGGLYDALGVCASEFRLSLGQLVDDHFRLAALLRHLCEWARTASGADADALRADVALFVKALGQHEQRELELVRRACEPGGGGPAVSGRMPA